jgi:lysophospholipase L1-like esterase
MLGTNDLKLRFNPQAFDIAAGAQRVALATMASQTGRNKTQPKVLMICPPPAVESPVFAHIFGDCVELSKKLPPLFCQLAAECRAAFLEAGLFIKSSPVDGIHFEIEEHRKLAAAVAEQIRRMA